MTDQVEQILWCKDCMTKHARDLLHHAEARGDSELKQLAERAFEISSDMLEVKEKGLYSDIRDLEHHAEDLITGLRVKRKELTGECTTCDKTENAMKRFMAGAKHINRGGAQLSNIEKMEVNMEKELVINAIAGNLGGNVVSRYITPMVPAVIPGVSGKTTGDLAIGGIVTALSLYEKLGKANVAGAILGTNLLATGILDIAMGLIPSGAPIAAPPAVSMGMASGRALYHTTIGAGAGMNGGLSYID